MALHAPDLLAQPHLLGNIVHQEQYVIYLPRPVHWHYAAVVDSNRNARRTVGQPLALHRMAARKYVSNLLFQAHFRKNYFWEYLRQPLAGSHAGRPAGFLEEVPVGEDHAQVLVQQ